MNDTLPEGKPLNAKEFIEHVQSVKEVLDKNKDWPEQFDKKFTYIDEENGEQFRYMLRERRPSEIKAFIQSLLDQQKQDLEVVRFNTMEPEEDPNDEEV